MKDKLSDIQKCSNEGFRRATAKDIDKIAKIFDDIHLCEEKKLVEIGWKRGVYPTIHTAKEAVERGDMFVAEKNGVISGAAIINQIQLKEYSAAEWQLQVSDELVMVLHTLVVSPEIERQGLGKSFVGFYEDYAKERGCKCLRLDTNERNIRARKMYKKLGYSEVGIVPCRFNGIDGVSLVLLEKII